MANELIGDPEVKYRKKVEDILQEDGDKIDEIFSRPILDELGRKLQILPTRMAEIEAEVLEPIHKYREFFERTIQKYSYGKREQKRIVEYRKMLGLEDEEYNVIERSVASNIIDTMPLESEQQIDYRQLRNLLKAEKWKEANQETMAVIRQVANLQYQYKNWPDSDAWKNFPCKDLGTIDQLWVVASLGRFGFSVQKKIWEECNAPTSYKEEDWRAFGDLVGWRRDGKWLDYPDLYKNLSNSPAGELPVINVLFLLSKNENEYHLSGRISLFLREDL
jgi:hypothetical protein